MNTQLPFKSLLFPKNEMGLHTQMHLDEKVLCVELTNEFPSPAHQLSQIPSGISEFSHEKKL